MRFVSVALALLLAGSAVAATNRPADGWLTDHAQAVKASQAQKKPLAMFFTGSDWCGWCKRLVNEVLSKPEFKVYSQKNLVFMEVDFPHGHALPAAVQKQNDELLKKYSIEGFPTLVIVDASGKLKGTLGYQEGGPKPFIRALEKLLKAR